jgi:FAD/FMN-containing dehydrogenase
MTDVSDLRSRVTGPVLVAGDPGYADESTSWILNFTHTPDVVVGAATHQDVVEAVRFAAEHRLPVRVQGTGHGAHAAITDGVLITTRRLDPVSIDAGSRSASARSDTCWEAASARSSTATDSAATGCDRSTSCWRTVTS